MQRGGWRRTQASRLLSSLLPLLLLGCANDGGRNTPKDAHATPQSSTDPHGDPASPAAAQGDNAAPNAKAARNAPSSSVAAQPGAPQPGDGPTASDTNAPQATDHDRYADPLSWPPRSTASTPPGDRIYSRVRHLWIRPAPNSKAWVGYLSLGDSVRVKDGDAERAYQGLGYTKTCRKWYAVEPTGFVCTGARATLDKDDPIIVSLRQHKADGQSPWPYQYGESLEVPVYHELPSPLRQKSREPRLERHLDALAARRAQHDAPEQQADPKKDPFFGVDLRAAGKAPPTLLELPVGGKPVKTRVAFGSTLAYVDSFDHGGRTFLLTWDRGIVPKDKVRPYPQSHFRGVVLGEQTQLPIAFMRERDRPKYRRATDGSFHKTEQSWPRLAWTALSGNSEVAGEVRYHETSEPGVWCADEDVTIARQARELPALIRRKKSGRRSWIDISILGGTLVAYEHDRPVYATLISPGRGGIPQRGVPPLDTASTPTGNYHVLGKFVTATMVSSSNENLVHSEVQYTQNITGPYALHGAYWHDRWGEKKSGGCVNLAPIDAQRIFHWTSPQIPPGWHGMRTIDFGDKTLVHLHR